MRVLLFNNPNQYNGSVVDNSEVVNRQMANQRKKLHKEIVFGKLWMSNEFFG